MAVFAYEAVDKGGKKVKAEVVATSREDAINRIKKLGYNPTSVMEKKGAPSAPPPPPTVQKKKGAGLILFGSGVSSKQLTQFTSQLSVLQDAGLPIVRSLKILEGQMKPCALKYIVQQVAEDVEGGSSLSEAMAKHPKVFDRLYVNMIKAGEAGGVLDTILQRLATFMEKAQKIKRKVIGAMIYPIAVVTIATLIVSGILIFVIPQFDKLFTEMGRTLPIPTQIVITASQILVQFWYLLPGIPLALFITYKAMQKNKGGKLFLDKMKLHMPIFGNIIRKSVIARFCRTLGTLIASGVPILEALAIVKNAIGNEVVSNAIQQVHDSIREGESIAEPLSQTGVFDDIVINMIDVGEETGELDKMLIKIADNYDDEVDTAVGAMMSILEPILIIGMGALIGFIVIALFLPLIDLISGMQAGEKGA